MRSGVCVALPVALFTGIGAACLSSNSDRQQATCEGAECGGGAGAGGAGVGGQGAAGEGGAAGHPGNNPPAWQGSVLVAQWRGDSPGVEVVRWFVYRQAGVDLGVEGPCTEVPSGEGGEPANPQIIDVTGGNLKAFLEAESRKEFSGALLNVGDVVTFSGERGQKQLSPPDFTETLTFPPASVLSEPLPAVIPVGSDWTIHFNPFAGLASVVLGGGSKAFDCRFDGSAGTATVPAKLLAYPGHFNFQITSNAEKNVKVGEFDVSFTAMELMFDPNNQPASGTMQVQ